MKEVNFKVKTESAEEYDARLEEFRLLLDTWKDKGDTRQYRIEENIEGLDFKIVATNEKDDNIL